MRLTRVVAAVIGVMGAASLSAHAEDTVRVSFIDPLGGPLAATGKLGEHAFGMARDTPPGRSVMRADNHPLLQPMLVPQPKPGERHVYADCNCHFKDAP